MKSKQTESIIGIFSIFINIVILVIIIIIVCTHFPRNGELGFDYMGIIVGVLSLLVTMLVGWQIFNLMDVNKKMSQLDDINNNIDIQIEKSKSEILSIIDDKIRKERMWNFLNYEYQAATKFMLNKEYDSAFRKFCYVACTANDMKESTLLESSIVMAKSIIKLNCDEFVAQKTTGFYPNMKERLKKIDNEAVEDIANFIEEKYGVFYKQK